MARFFLTTYVAFFISSTAFSVLGDEFVEIEHLWLTQNIHVSAEYLCQDGVYIYFKDQNACSMATPAVSCKHSRKISPINYIEKVELPDGEVVTQFFTIPTVYQFSKYELSEGGPIKSYDLVLSQQIPLPVCEGMQKHQPKKIRKFRKAKKAELAFMQGMVDSGVTIVNSPYGAFDPDSLMEFEQVADSDQVPQLKSPLCSKQLDYQELVTKASGEWTGNGVIKLNSLREWQERSADLYIQKIKDQNNQVQYEFFCRDEESNG